MFSKWFQKEDKKSGTIAEDLACQTLKQKKYQIIKRNFSCPLGEIDIIARDKEILVFVEVKYRSQNIKGNINRTVPHQKQQKIIKTSKWYLNKFLNSNQVPSCRFDVITLVGNIESPEINHIENAFLS
ncbi:MAG: YraN family protein [Planctomycetota bacterium]|nr:MAG: YraN family protein [Planctomycetota bacterium]